MSAKIDFLYLSEPDMIKAVSRTWENVWKSWKT